MRYFRPSEFQCHCGCGMLPEPHILDICDHLRHALGVPLVVHSGARCASWNAKVGGALLSQHVKGLAVDLRWPRGHETKLLALLHTNGAKGVGLYKSFVHADWRSGQRAFWTQFQPGGLGT